MDEMLYELWMLCDSGRCYRSTIDRFDGRPITNNKNEALRAAKRLNKVMTSCQYHVREIISELDALAILGGKNG